MAVAEPSPSLPSRQVFREAVGLTAFTVGPMCAGAMLTVLIPILPNISKMLSGGAVGTFSTQALVAAPMFGLVTGGLSATLIFSRFTVRGVFLTALIAYGLLGAFGMIAPAAPLIVSRFLIGFTCACLGAASTAFIGDRVRPERRARVLGLQMAGSSLTAIGAMLLSGFLADRYGWRTSFTIFPVLALVVFVAAAWGTGVRNDDTHRVPPAALNKGSFALVAALWPFFLFVVAINVAGFTTNSQSSFVLAGEGVTTASGRAGVMGLNQIMLVIGALVFPWVRAFFTSRFMPTVVLVIMATGLLALGLTHGIKPATAALALLGLGNGWLYPFQTSLLLQRAAPNVRGQAAGVMTASQFAADAVNPLLLAPIIAVIGLKAAIAMVGGLALAGAIAAAVFSKASDEPNTPVTLGHH